MGEVFGMEVNLELVVKNINDIKKQVKDAMKDIPANLQAQVAGATKGIQAGVGAGGAEAAAAATGMGGAIGKAIGSMTLITGAVLVMAEGIKKIVSVLKASSPYLKGIFDIFGRTLSIFFRPFGDFLASLLKPLAIILLKVAATWMRTVGPTARDVGSGLGAIIGEAVKGAQTGAGITGKFGAPIVGAGIGGALGGLSVPAKGIANLFKIAGAWIDELLSVFGIDMTVVRRAVVTFIYETIPDFFTKTLPDWFNTAVDTIGDLGTWIWDTLTEKFTVAWESLSELGSWTWTSLTETFMIAWEKLKGFGEWFWTNLTESYATAWEKLKGFGTWLWDTLTAALENITTSLAGVGTWILDAIKGALSSLNPFGNGGGNQVGLNHVPKTGMYLLHQGEKVTGAARSHSENRSIVIRPQITFSGSISSNVDVDSAMRRASRQIALELRGAGYG